MEYRSTRILWAAAVVAFAFIFACAAVATAIDAEDDAPADAGDAACEHVWKDVAAKAPGLETLGWSAYKACELCGEKDGYNPLYLADEGKITVTPSDDYTVITISADEGYALPNGKLTIDYEYQQIVKVGKQEQVTTKRATITVNIKCDGYQGEIEVTPDYSKRTVTDADFTFSGSYGSKHYYGAPSVNWGPRNETATFTFLCKECRLSKIVEADVDVTEADGKRTCTAVVILEGKKYVETVVTEICNHVWDEGDVTVSATCTTDGEAVFTCTVCGATETRVVPAPGHKEAVILGYEPTCIDTGLSDGKMCLTCGTITVPQQQIPARGHSPGEMVVENVVDPTCAKEGSYEEAVYCTVCEKEVSRKLVTVPAIDHVPGEAVIENEVPATCTEEGSYDEAVYCTVCKNELSRETVFIAMIDHVPGEAVIENEVPATCTEDGSYDSVVYCAVCGEELSKETVEVPALGHEPAEAVAENEVPATCEEDGSYDSVVYCDRCKAELSKENVAVPALGHEPAEAVIENEVPADCLNDGSYDSVVYCAVCERELSRENVAVPALGHEPADAVAENEVPATCEEDGSYDSVVYCDRCEAELSRENVAVPALGHEPADAVIENFIDSDCATEGSFDSVVYCAVCEKELSRSIIAVPLKEHAPGEETVENEVAPDCVNDGSYDIAVYCTVCGNETSRETVVVPALGHDFAAPVINWADNRLESCFTATCGVCGYIETIPTEVACEAHGFDMTYTATAIFEGAELMESMTECVCVHEWVDIAGQAPAGGEAGWLAYRECSICKAVDGYQEVLSAGAEQTSIAIEGIDTVVLSSDEGYVLPDGELAVNYVYQVTVKIGGKEQISEKAGTLSVPVESDGLQSEIVINPDFGDKNVVAIKGASYNGAFNEGHVHEWSAPAVEWAEDNSSATFMFICAGCNLAQVVEGAATAVEDEFGTEYSVEVEFEGAKYSDSKYVPFCEHEFDEGVVTVEPTCTETGTTVYTCVKCGYSYEEEAPLADHVEGESDTENFVEATCTVDGGYDIAIYCAVCGEEMSRTHFVLPCGHKEVAVEGYPATCYETGLTDGTVCSVCGEVVVPQEEIPLAEHTPGEAVVENEVEPTCVDGSYDSVVYCEVCGAEVSREAVAVPASGEHTWSDWAMAVEPEVGKAAGSQERACEVCGEVESRGIIILKAIVTIPETEGLTSGSIRVVCGEDVWLVEGMWTVEGAVITDFTDPIGVFALTRPSTVSGDVFEAVFYAVEDAETYGIDFILDLSVNGVTSAADYEVLYECLSCEHEYDEGVYTVEPTCTEPGEILYTCVKCGYACTEEAPALGHEPAEAVIENEAEPGCVDDGGYDSVVYCAVCGEELSREFIVVPALGHEPADAVIENEAEPGCVDDGGYDSVVYCAVCGEELSREFVVVPALGHEPMEAVEENLVDCDCENDGSYDSVVYCAVCGEELSRDVIVIPAKGHYEVPLYGYPATCTEPGMTDGVICTVCDKIIVAPEVIPAMGHDPLEAVEENLVDSDCVNDGSYDSVVYCAVCGEELSRDVAVIPAKGHDFAECVGDETGHWHVCSVCGETDEVQDHVFENGVCTECGYTAIIRGDLNEDGIVDYADAVYLLYHVFFSEMFPLNQDGDFNKDGIVDYADAVYLLYHVFFEEQFPL